MLPFHRRPRPIHIAPLVAAQGALVLGILGASWLDGVPIALLLGAAFVCLAAGTLLTRRPGWLAAALLIPVALFGAVRTRFAQTPVASDISHQAGGMPVWVEGTVQAEPEQGAFHSRRYLLAVNAVEDTTAARMRPATGWLQVTQQRASTGRVPLAGDSVRLRGRIERPHPATNPGAFDYAAHLARRGIFATLTVRYAADMQPGRGEAGWSIQRVAGALRTALRRATAHHLAPEDAALLDGLLLSARGRLPADLEDAFARTGAVHVLSTSGLHLAAVAGVFVVLLRLLPGRRRGVLHITAVLAGIALLWLYTLAAGAGPAAVRAAVTATVFLLAPLARRESDPLHSLALAAFVLLSVWPLALYDPGVQLSFAAVGLLLLWVPALERLWLPWEPGMRRRSLWARSVCLLLLVGVVAHLATWPLVAYHFSQLSLVAPLANLVLVPVSEALLLLGLATAGLSAVLPEGIAGALLAPLWGSVHYLLTLLRMLTFAFAAPSGAAISLAPPPVWFLALYYSLLGGIAPFVRRRALAKMVFAPVQDSETSVNRC